MIEHLKKPVAQVLALLAQGAYEELAELTHGIRLSAAEIAYAVQTHGRTLVTPPDHAFELMDAIQVRGAEPPRWSVTIPAWTKEEGRSDLSLELTLIERGADFDIEFDDLHVL